MSAFIVIYRWRVAEEQEQAFQQQWREITLQLRTHGGLGSCLTRNSAGEFVAIALWPSEHARFDAFTKLPPSPTIQGVERLEESRLRPVEDLWLNSPFRE